jgi:hypothetical protein
MRSEIYGYNVAWMNGKMNVFMSKILNLTSMNARDSSVFIGARQEVKIEID